ncbi:ABC transporter permease [Paenibacillus sp. BT-177]|uniref:ABC transporter permease n=1 Tax=Paenibacillus sp. BT-177 TaxID=2986930 RepID=UPI0021F6C4FF|nr:ABC transporter permease [Paenibacillus sp. BT-177]
MKTLVYSEFERLWRRKWFWLLVLCTPVLVYSTGIYIQHTLRIPMKDLSKIFIVAGLRENLYLICNFAVATLVAAVFTEEFRSGQLRLLFVRRFTRGQIFWSKLLVVNTSILLLLIVYAVSSQVIVVFWKFSHNINGTDIFGQIWSQVFEYYGWAFASLLAISSLYSFIAMCSKSVTYAIGICMTYNLGVLLFDPLYMKLATLFSSIPLLKNLIPFLLIPYLQYKGLDQSLIWNWSVNGAIVIAVLFHLILFTGWAYRRFTTDDYLY